VKSEISCSDLREISSNFGSCRPSTPDKADLQDGKLIVMVQVGDGYTDFFENWYRFAEPHINRDCMQVLAVIDDKPTEAAVKNLRERHDWSFATAMADDFSFSDKLLLNTGSGVPATLESKHPYGSTEYDKSMSLRPRALDQFLSKDCSIVFSDIDLIWRKDIFAEIHQLNRGTANLYGFDDYVSDNKPAEICGGFLYMNPTAWTLKVAHEWSDRLSEHPGTNQGPLNDIIKKMPGGYGSMDFLPRATYLNPNTRGSRDLDQVTIVHANWVVGSSDKRKFLEEMKLWQVDGDGKLIQVGSSADAAAMTVDSIGDAETATNATSMTLESTGLASPIMRHD